MPHLANDDLQRWSETLIELGRMRLAAERADADRVFEIDLSPYGVQPGAPRYASASVFEMRQNLDMLIEDLVLRTREDYVHKIMHDPFPEQSMMLVILLARKLADETQPLAN